MHTPSVIPAKGIDLMLSPQFYTLVREEIPIKYHYQARAIAPSLFEGLLEEGGSYQYFVTRHEEEWLFIAYDVQKIVAFLQERGIASSAVSRLFFAQEASEAFDMPMSLSSSEALVLIDGNVTVVPKAILGDVSFQPFVEAFRPSGGGVRLSIDSGKLLSFSDTMTLVAILVLFGIVYLVEASRYSGENKEIQEQMQKLLSEAPTLTSSYTRESILSKYRAIDKSERMKREVIKSLSRMIFNGSILTKLSLNARQFEAHFSYKDPRTLKRLQELAKKESFRTSTLSTGVVKIEGGL
jgi:hypothetical protein